MTVSVLMPARDAAQTLDSAIASVQAQDHGDWELIVIENGSVDDTAAIAHAAATVDERIRVIEVAAANAGDARNAGLGVATRPSVLFLDADDALLPTALGVLSGALVDEEVTVAYTGSLRVSPSGRRLAQDPALEDRRPVDRFGETCAIAINAAMVRTEAVRRLGGFDPALATCEDWDLWLRLAQDGAVFARVAGHHAEHRSSARSAMADAGRLLSDARTVIERASRGPASETGRAARPLLNFTAFAAAIAIAAGQPVEPLLQQITDVQAPGLDAVELAWNLATGLLVVAPDGLSDWEGRMRHQLGLERVLAELSDRSGTADLVGSTHAAVDEILLDHLPRDVLRQVGETLILPVDVDAPLADAVLPPGAHQALVVVRAGGAELGSSTIPAAQGHITAHDLGDLIADRHTWSVLGAALHETVYRVPGRLGPASIQGDPHDAVGWHVFLQELLGRPGLQPEELFDLDTDWGPGFVLTGPEVDVLHLADARVAEDGHVPIALRCCGRVIAVLVEPEGGWGRPGALVRAAAQQVGFELCRAVVRTALVGRPWGAGLRELLTRATSETQQGAGCGRTHPRRASPRTP